MKKSYIKYPKNKENILNDITSSVKRGEIFGFIGPNGAGKSTTVKILIGLLKNYCESAAVMSSEAKTQIKIFYRTLFKDF